MVLKFNWQNNWIWIWRNVWKSSYTQTVCLKEDPIVFILFFIFISNSLDTLLFYCMVMSHYHHLIYLQSFQYHCLILLKYQTTLVGLRCLRYYILHLWIYIMRFFFFFYNPQTSNPATNSIHVCIYLPSHIFLIISSQRQCLCFLCYHC